MLACAVGEQIAPMNKKVRLQTRPNNKALVASVHENAPRKLIQVDKHWIEPHAFNGQDDLAVDIRDSVNGLLMYPPHAHTNVVVFTIIQHY